MNEVNKNYILKKISGILENQILPKVIYCCDLGTVSYQKAFDIQMKTFKHVKNSENSGILFVLEHTPVITIGSNRNRDNILISESELKKQRIEIYQSTRGIDITLHAPGQIVCYPILNLSMF